MNGYKTFLGAAITLCGFFLSGYMSETEIEKSMSAVVELVGIGLVVYGRIKARKNY